MGRTRPGDSVVGFSRKVRDVPAHSIEPPHPTSRKPLQTIRIRSSCPNQPQAQLDVQLNSPFFCVCGVDSRGSACTIAAHAGRPSVARQDAVGGARTRARADPRAAAGPAGLPAHGQGFRPAAGRPEVRPREGESHPHPLPDLPQQDDRRPVRAPARRARPLPAPIAPILVITGPSGVGKGTLIKGLLERVTGLQLAVSATTREPRDGEVNGVDYHFLSAEDFDRRVAHGEFVEHAEYAGNRYGTLKSELERPARGIVLEIDVQGARQVRETLPDAVLIFIEPPSFEDLERRLAGRGSDKPEQIERRLAAAREELAAAGEFDHRIRNDDLERALEELSELAATMCPP